MGFLSRFSWKKTKTNTDFVTLRTGRFMRRQPFDFVPPRRPLPINPRTDLPYTQYYGFAVSPEWLVEFAERNCPEELPPRDDKSYEDVAMTRAFEFIREWPSMYTLERKTCFNPKGGSVPPKWFTRYHDDEDDGRGIETVHVFAIYSDQEDEFGERPAQYKVEAITEMMEYMPRWFVSCG
ncbi:hypothetical protein DFH29DRAFT_905015 [Suillus ampliporus]|nr:hypothetical protein DFH29DRAFT_905015 [Suillus ampliporus]